MPVPLIVPILTAVGGGIIGALSRQPEINRLKQQVKVLQKEVARLQTLIREQDRQINSLRMQVNSLKGYQQLQMLGKTKGAVMQQYAFKEYVELCCELVKEKNISPIEQRFFNIYENLLHGLEIDLDDKVFLRDYVVERYGYQISNLETIDSSEVVARLEGTKVA